MRIPIFLLVFLVGQSASLFGLNLDGRLTSSLYTYEGQKTDTTSIAYLRAYQSVRLNLSHLGASQLSFQTYVRGTTDLREQADTDPRLRLYSANLVWKEQNYQFRLGRQRIYAGVGYGTIDGLRGNFKLSGFNLALYAGPLVPLDKSADLNSWSAGHLWGARIGTSRFFGTDLSLSVASRERESTAYADIGRYSEKLIPSQVIVQRLVGLDIHRRFAPGHTLYGRLDYDLKDASVRRVEVRGRYSLAPSLSVQAEWLRRSPAVFYNSIFSVFPSEDYQEIGGRLYYTLNPGLQLTAHFSTLLYDGDSAQRLGLVASIGDHYSIDYYRSMGYARASDGLVGSLYYPLGRKFLFRGELDLATYERYEQAEERDELVTGSLGLTYRPTRRTFLELQLQGLRNPLYASDARLFLRGSWHFFKRGEK